MIDGPILTDVIASGKVRVPSAPTSAMRIHKVMHESKGTASALAEVVSLDPPLAAAVLRAANTGDFKDLVPVASVPDAIARIQVEALPNIALAVRAADLATNDGPLAQLRLLAWRRSVTSAMICRFAAQHRGGRAADAFACGLLHDFGWIVALSALEDLLADYPDEKQRTAESWMTLVDQFHILLGHITAVRWDLPPLIAEVILCHHMPEKSSLLYRPMVELVALSDRLVTLLEQHPAITEDHLAKLSGVEWDLATALARALPQIAAETSQLLEMFPGTRPLAPPAASKVSHPGATLRGTVKPVRWEVAWLNRERPVPGVISAVASDGLAMTLPEAPKENFVIKLAVSAAGQAFEIFATPLKIERTDGQHRIEARLFAMGGASKKIWDHLYAATE